MKEIRVGLIGCGFMGKTHIYGYKTIPVYYEPDFKIKLVGVCNRNIEKAQQAKELYGFDFATTREIRRVEGYDSLGDRFARVVGDKRREIVHRRGSNFAEGSGNAILDDIRRRRGSRLGHYTNQLGDD